MRGLLRVPGFTLLTVLMLGLGIGANAAIFSVVYGVLLRPLPLTQPERLVAVAHTLPGIGTERANLSDAAYRFYQERTRSLAALGIYFSDEANLTGGAEPERVTICVGTASVFSALAVPPVLGRTLVAEDERPGADPVSVISFALWHRRFGADPAVLGRTLRLDGIARRLVGVMPNGFAFPRPETAIWNPLTIDPAHLAPANFNYAAIGRLRDGVTAEQASREMSTLAQGLPDAVGEPFTRASLEAWRLAVLVRDLRDARVGEVARTLWTLFGSAGLILLIACANVANLILLRAEGRRREIALRIALGASRGQAARLFLGESLVLGLAGGVTGLALAALGLRLLLWLRPPGIPRLDEIGIGNLVLAFTFLLALVVGLLAGALAAVLSTHPDLVPALKEGGRTGTGGRSAQRSRRTLAAIQLALALALVIGAALMLKSYRRLASVDPGVKPDGLLTVLLTLPRTQYPDARAVARFVRDVQERVEAVPRVRSAAFVSQLPLDGGFSNSRFAIEDHPLPEGAAAPELNNQFVSPGYFTTMGIPVLAGTTVERIDPERRQAEVVISRAVAMRFWPTRSALGKRLTPEAPREGEWYTVAGVVGDVHEVGLAKSPTEVVYFGWRRLADQAGVDHWVPPGGTLVVRTAGSPAALAKPVRDAVHAVDPAVPVDRVRTMDEVVARSTARSSFAMLLLGIAAAMALLLGAIGVYGVIAYLVSQRTREIGVRMALGARRSDIARMVVWNGLQLALAGVAVGLVAAFWLVRFLGKLLYQVSPTDPAIFAGVPLFLTLVVLLASWVPARRAASVEPSEAIRTE